MAKLGYLLILFTLLSFTSCLDDSDDEPLMFLDLGILNHYGTSEYMIITDDGIVLLTENLPRQIDFDDNARVSLRYHVLRSAPENDSIKADYWVDVDAITELITKEIVVVNDSTIDSLGTAPVEFQKVWITQDFLTVYFTFYGGSKVHDFNLTYNEDGQGEDEFTYLTFQHQDNKDEQVKQYWAYVTFRLNSLRKEGQSEIKIHFRGKQNNEDDYIQSDLVYRY